MERAKKTRLRRWAVGIILAGLVLFAIWYHIPLHRSFFRGTMARGTIELDGASYVSAPRMEPTPSSFLAGLRDKWSGIIYSGYFVEAERLAGRGDFIYMKEDSLWIASVSFRGFYDSIEGLILVRSSPDAPNVVYTVDPLTRSLN